MITLEQQTQTTSELINYLIEAKLWITLKDIRETLESTIYLYPTEENKEMIERIDKSLLTIEPKY